PAPLRGGAPRPPPAPLPGPPRAAAPLVPPPGRPRGRRGRRRPGVADPGTHRAPAGRCRRRPRPRKEGLMGKKKPSKREPAPPETTPLAVRDYAIVSMAALLVLAVVLNLEGLGWWAVPPPPVSRLAGLAPCSVGVAPLPPV